MAAMRATGPSLLYDASTGTFGILLLGVSVIMLVGLILVDGRAGISLAMTMLMELVMGREATVPVALTGGVPPWVVLATSATQNVGLAAVVVAVIDRAGASAPNDRYFLPRVLRRIRTAARRREWSVRRWGPVGLFCFMLLPFAANGAVVAASAARLAGLSGRRLWIPVIAGVLLTATAWTYAYHWSLPLVARLDPRLPFLASGILVIMTALIIRRELAIMEQGNNGAASGDHGP